MARKTEEVDPWKIYFYAQSVFDKWSDTTRPAFFSQASRNRRVGMLLQARQQYLSQIHYVEQLITKWADAAKKEGKRTSKVEWILRHQCGRIRKSIQCIDPDDVAARFPEYQSLVGVIGRGELTQKVTVN